MTHEFWHNAWKSGKTGWRQQRVNTRLVHYWPGILANYRAGNAQFDSACLAAAEVALPATETVFVPLCGDSPDLAWLHDSGHPVVGSELDESAIRKFFTDRNIAFEVEVLSNMQVFRSLNVNPGYSLVCGDFFALEPVHLGGATLVYDRAATVALPADLRPVYAKQMATLVPADSDVLLLSFVYDQSKMDGPPFSVSEREVEANYGGYFSIERLGGASGPDIVGNLKDRGLDSLEEIVFRLRRNARTMVEA